MKFLLIRIIVALLFTAVTVRGQRLVRYEDSRISMACAYSIVVYGDESQPLSRIVSDAFDEVDRIDRLMSHYKPDSPLSRLNREAALRPVKAERELFDFIAECLRYSRASDGAFDITVGPLMKAWGFFRGEGHLPTDDELAAARSRTGFHHLILNAKEQTIQFDRPGVELDLGGIAKGYAVDRAISALKQRGIKCALVSAGGSTIYGLGSPPESDGWQIEIQHPLDARKTAMTVHLKDQALSVSGSSEKFFEVNGARYSHIMNPRTGRPVEGVLSVAVLTSSGTAGDALDNVFFVAGVKRSRTLLNRFPGTEVFFFLPEAGKGWKLAHLKQKER
ncbi:MAG: FAD:protein FMN transferase [Blastocatellia bacterium]